MISTKDVNPTLEEIRLFTTSSNDSSGNDALEEYARLTQERLAKDGLNPLATKFETGDIIRIMKGELRNMIGRVISVNGETGMVKFIPIDKHVKLDRIDYPAIHLAHHIKVGMHIKVLSGEHIGETGVVTKIVAGEGEHMNTVLFSGDSNKQVYEVLQTEVKESRDIVGGAASLNGYALYDLIEFGFKRVGIIIAFGRDDVDVLDIFGNVSKIALNEIAGKRNHFTRNSAAVDAESNPLRNRDVVTVMQ